MFLLNCNQKRNLNLGPSKNVTMWSRCSNHYAYSFIDFKAFEHWWKWVRKNNNPGWEVNGLMVVKSVVWFTYSNQPRIKVKNKSRKKYLPWNFLTDSWHFWFFMKTKKLWKQSNKVPTYIWLVVKVLSSYCLAGITCAA